jgi:hypothetical protein
MVQGLLPAAEVVAVARVTPMARAANKLQGFAFFPRIWACITQGISEQVIPAKARIQ